MKKIDFFQSSDLALSSFLFNAGFLIEATQKENFSNRTIFSFKRTPELDELVQSFWKRETTVEPQTYFQAIRSLKARIFGG